MDYSSQVLLSNSVALFLGLPSMILFTAEVAIIFLNVKEFRTSFFGLFIVRAVLSIISYILSFVTIRFGTFGLFTTTLQTLPSICIKILFISNYYTFYAENVITVFLLFNRLTSILLPFSHHQLWTYLFPGSILLAAFLPIYLLRMLWLKIFYIRIQDEKSLTFTIDYKRKDNQEAIDDSSQCAYYALIFMSISLITNIATVLAFRMQKNSRGPNDISKENRRITKEKENVEFRLTIYAFITFLGHLMCAFFYVLIYLANVLNSQYLFLVVFLHWPWINDVGTIAIPAWTLVWASTVLRKHLKFCWNRNKLFKKTSVNITVSGVNSAFRPPKFSHHSIQVQNQT